MNHSFDHYTQDQRKKKPGGEKPATRKGGGGVKLSTDPQSVAARERRHRISDRLKTLQSLVPGGAKLDTVSLLEQAIQYVGFLKSQIWFHHRLLLSAANNSAVDVNGNVVPLLPSSTEVSCDPAMALSYDGVNGVVCSSDEAAGGGVVDPLPASAVSGGFYGGHGCFYAGGAMCSDWSSTSEFY